jgi:uncharacterized pyridoxal phosphate-dependent enzyme
LRVGDLISSRRGLDLARAERLPDTAGLKNEVVLQRGHHITYGGYVAQNVAMVGARLVEIGAATECGAYQLVDALGPATAAGVYVVSHHTVQSGLIDLETFCRCCHERNVPVIVDAAAEPDPRIFLRAGADLVITSMQKAFAGFTAATVAGRLDLVRACYLQEKGIGRPMKVGKEGIVATIAALERWEKLDHAVRRAELDRRLCRAQMALEDLPGLKASIEPDASGLFARLHLQLDPTHAALSASELSIGLWNETPSIFVRDLKADIGLLQLDFRRVSDEVAETIAAAIRRLMAPADGRMRASGGVQAAPNLADAAFVGALRFPLAIKESR